MRYHWIRNVLEDRLLELAKVHTDDNGADMMTKHCRDPSLRLVVRSPAWRSSPHSCEGEICWRWAPILCEEKPKF